MEFSWWANEVIRIFGLFPWFLHFLLLMFSWNFCARVVGVMWAGLDAEAVRRIWHCGVSRGWQWGFGWRRVRGAISGTFSSYEESRCSVLIVTKTVWLDELLRFSQSLVISVTVSLIDKDSAALVVRASFTPLPLSNDSSANSPNKAQIKTLRTVATTKAVPQPLILHQTWFPCLQTLIFPLIPAYGLSCHSYALKLQTRAKSRH
jgi:hypothetical protein